MKKSKFGSYVNKIMILYFKNNVPPNERHIYPIMTRCWWEDHMENRIAAMSSNRNVNICFKKRIHAIMTTSKLKYKLFSSNCSESQLPSFLLSSILGKQSCFCWSFLDLSEFCPHVQEASEPQKPGARSLREAGSLLHFAKSSDQLFHRIIE